MNSLNPENWIDTYADYLYSLAVLRTNSREDAEDIVQEALLSAYRAKDSFKGESSEKTWLTAILNNKINDHFRKKYSAKPLADYLMETEAAFQQSFFDEGNHGRFKTLVRPNHFSNSGEDYLLGEEFQQIIELCILKMPQKLRNVFMAKYLNEEKSEDICKEHSLSSSNFWVIIHRSKLLLRSCLEKQGML